MAGGDRLAFESLTTREERRARPSSRDCGRQRRIPTQTTTSWQSGVPISASAASRVQSLSGGVEARPLAILEGGHVAVQGEARGARVQVARADCRGVGPGRREAIFGRLETEHRVRAPGARARADLKDHEVGAEVLVDGDGEVGSATRIVRLDLLARIAARYRSALLVVLAVRRDLVVAEEVFRVGTAAAAVIAAACDEQTLPPSRHARIELYMDVVSSCQRSVASGSCVTLSRRAPGRPSRPRCR